MRDDDSEEAILATVEKWYEAFASSPDFAQLSEDHQRKAGAITQFFAQYAFNYLEVVPRGWRPSDVIECCTEILPQKVSAEINFFEAMAPVLSAFFEFLRNQSLLPQGRALAQAVAGAHNRIVTAAKDRRNWGPAKSFVMAAHEAGVDIQDEKALQQFLVQFKLQRMARTGSATPDASRPASAGSWPGKPAFKPPANRYDPCPCGSGKKYKFCCEQRG